MKEVFIIDYNETSIYNWLQYNLNEVNEFADM